MLAFFRVFVLAAGLCGLCQGADVQYMRQTIMDHFSNVRNHNTNMQYKAAAKEFILQEFGRMGLETVSQSFYHNEDQMGGTNVIGIMKGSNYGTAKDMIIGLAAHYDTVETSPGVDDNGAGVAAMLNTASQLTSANKKGRTRNNTVIFVSFDLEEYGFLGSKYFIPEWFKPQFKLSGLQGFIVMDTMMDYNTTAHSQTIRASVAAQFQQLFPNVTASIASDHYEGDFVVNAYRKQTGDQKLAKTFEAAWKAARSQTYDIESFGLPKDILKSPYLFFDFLRSDHARFWENNMPAIFLSDSADMRGRMQGCYHHACDNLEVMLTDDNLNFLAQTVDSLIVTIDQLSEPSQGTSSSSVAIPSPLLLAVVLLFLK